MLYGRGVRTGIGKYLIVHLSVGIGIAIGNVEEFGLASAVMCGYEFLDIWRKVVLFGHFQSEAYMLYDDLCTVFKRHVVVWNNHKKIQDLAPPNIPHKNQYVLEERSLILRHA